MIKARLVRLFLPLNLALTLIVGIGAEAAGRFQLHNLQSVPFPLEKASVALKPDASMGTVKLEDENHVIIAEWNVANEMEVGGTSKNRRRIDRGREQPPWKFPAKQKKIKESAIHLGLGTDELPHFIISPEVETAKAADRLFNTDLLNGKYKTFLIDGNDPSGIDIAIALRADLALTVEMETHQHVMWYDPIAKSKQRLFSRDLPVLIVRDPATKAAKLILVGYHGKSKRDRKGDRESDQLATAQFFAAAEIIKSLRQRFAGVPLITAGDLNRDVRIEEEVLPLKGELTDAFDIVAPNTRVTQTFYPRGGGVVESQLDAIMVSEEVMPHILKTMVIPEFHHETGEPLPFTPRSFQDREDSYPSDHRMTAIVVSGKLFRP